MVQASALVPVDFVLLPGWYSLSQGSWLGIASLYGPRLGLLRYLPSLMDLRSILSLLLAVRKGGGVIATPVPVPVSH